MRIVTLHVPKVDFIIMQCVVLMVCIPLTALFCFVSSSWCSVGLRHFQHDWFLLCRGLCFIGSAPNSLLPGACRKPRHLLCSQGQLAVTLAFELWLLVFQFVSSVLPFLGRDCLETQDVLMPSVPSSVLHSLPLSPSFQIYLTFCFLCSQPLTKLMFHTEYKRMFSPP